jgi:hypothetical protein
MGLFERGFERSNLRGQMYGFGIWLAVTVVGAALHPDPSGHGTHTQLGLPPCPSAFLFDRPCPGCGMTTSWSATIHGDLPAAFAAHPLGPILYGAFTAYALAGLFGWFRRLKLNTDSLAFSRALLGLAVLVVTFGIVRAAITPNYGSGPESRFALLNVKSQP